MTERRARITIDLETRYAKFSEACDVQVTRMRSGSLDCKCHSRHFLPVLGCRVGRARVTVGVEKEEAGLAGSRASAGASFLSGSARGVEPEGGGGGGGGGRGEEEDPGAGMAATRRRRRLDASLVI